MEHYKIPKLLNGSTVSMFVARKWIAINDLSIGHYSVNKNIRFKTSMLRSDLCDYSDAYIVVKGTVALLVAAANENDKAEKNVTFKNNAPFRSCISNISSTLMDNAEHLDMVMPMYNLLEYSQNYSMSSGSLWNYYRDKIDDVDDGKLFRYKTKIVGKTLERPPRPGNQGDANRPPTAAVITLNIEVTIPLKYVFHSDMRNCEIELDLSRTKECVLVKHHNNLTGVNFMIIYVPVVTLSMNDNMKFLEK